MKYWKVWDPTPHAPKKPIFWLNLHPIIKINCTGEYPAVYEVDGFTKRLFDYVEFERYQETDALRWEIWFSFLSFKIRLFELMAENCFL